jgi:histidinol phosphatase-like enzyme
MKILFLDLDGTVRKTKSGATFINDPYIPRDDLDWILDALAELLKNQE